MALAKSVRIAARKAPFLMGPKALLRNGRSPDALKSSLVRRETVSCYSVGTVDIWFNHVSNYKN